MRVWTVGTVVAILAAAATVPAFAPGLGVPAWHHAASMLVTLAVYAAASYTTRSPPRRHQALGVAVWSIVAIVTGFLILYLKADLKATGLKDWAKFWHVAWSWLALWYAAGHTWLNRRGLARAFSRWMSGIRRPVLLGGLVLVAAAVPLTWSPLGARLFVEEDYIGWTLYTWLALLVPAYAAWWLLRGRPGIRVEARLFVDTWLLPATLLANLSGVPILFFGTKDTALKHVAKYWHTWPSIAMAILVFAHTVQFWPAMARHLRPAVRKRSA